MEGHRRYAEEPEPSWYTGQRAAQTPDPNLYDSAVHERPSGAFRLPDQRSADPYSAPPDQRSADLYSAPPDQRPVDPYSAPPAGYGTPDPVTTSGSHALSSADSGSIRIPVRGPEYPAVRPSGATAPADPPAVSTVTTTTTYGSGVNAGAEPTSMVPITGARAPEAVYGARRPVSAIVFAVVTIILLIPAGLLLVQATFVDDPTARGVVPAVLLMLGLPMTGFGLYSLAGGGVSAREAWLRPPLAYLPVGLVLLLAAGLGVA